MTTTFTCFTLLSAVEECASTAAQKETLVERDAASRASEFILPVLETKVEKLMMVSF